MTREKFHSLTADMSSWSETSSQTRPNEYPTSDCIAFSLLSLLLLFKKPFKGKEIFYLARRRCRFFSASLSVTAHIPPLPLGEPGKSYSFLSSHFLANWKKKYIRRTHASAPQQPQALPTPFPSFHPVIYVAPQELASTISIRPKSSESESLSFLSFLPLSNRRLSPCIYLPGGPERGRRKVWNPRPNASFVSERRRRRGNENPRMSF